MIALGEYPGCSASLRQDCSTVSSNQWGFDEGEFCRNCPYVFYVVADCTNTLHLPNHDVEAMRLSIVDLKTGELVSLRAENECARRRFFGDPFLYCDGCSNPLLSSLVPKDDPGALAQALLRTISEPSLRERLAAKGRAAYEAEFTEEIVVGRYLELFEALSKSEGE